MTRSSGSFDIQVRDLHWIIDGDGADDLCAHGNVTVRIGDRLISGEEGRDLCVSAGALHLLRTLTLDHGSTLPTAEHLIPHCGHVMIEIEQDVDIAVAIIGCMSGLDWEVLHVGDGVALTAGDATITIPLEEWRDALCTFSDTVESFYERSAPKQPTIDDAAGYLAFRREWARRRRAADEIGAR